MRTRLLATVASFAFVAAGVAAHAQDTQRPDRNAPAGHAEPNAAQPNRMEPNRMEPNRPAAGQNAPRAEAPARPETAPRAAEGENRADQPRRAEAPRQGEPQERAANPDNRNAPRNAENGDNRNAPRNAENGDNKAAPRDADNGPDRVGPRGPGQPRVVGRVQTSTEHANRVTELLRRQGRREHVDFAINVGARIPENIEVYPLPPEVIAIAPEYRGYDYFIDDDEIVFVAPESHEIVGEIEYEGRAADEGVSVSAARPCPIEN